MIDKFITLDKFFTSFANPLNFNLVFNFYLVRLTEFTTSQANAYG